MRFSVLMLCFLSLGAFAQVTIPASQSRNVLSSVAAGGNVGSPLLAFSTGGTIAGWSLDSETNPGGLGVDTAEFFFGITNAGQMTVLQDLSRLFAITANTSVSISLTVRAFDDMNMVATETVTVNVVLDSSTQGQPPSIFAGQTRNVVVTTAAGQGVGDPILATNDPDGWSIDLEDNYADRVVANVDEFERFFDISNTGQITVLQSLERFFNAFSGRGDQLFVELTVSTYNATGSDTQVIRVFIVEGTTPAFLGSQTRTVVSSANVGTNLQDPLQTVGNPTYFSIVGGSTLDDGAGGVSATGAFSINNAGQISTTIFLDVFFYNANPFPVTLTVVAGNQYGESAPTVVPIDISVVSSGRCGSIPDTQTRYVSSTGVVDDAIGLPIDTHGLDSIWIQEAWLDLGGSAPTNVASFFTIEDGTSFGQMRVSRDMALQFDPAIITKVEVLVRGHIVAPQCPGFVDQIINVYVLPSDASGGGTGTGTGTDFSSYIDDAALLSCIRETLGLQGGDFLTAALILNTEQLDCACRNDDAIADLDGLHLFTELVQLNLANNLVSDIRPLSGLEKLTDLRLAGNLIEDITSSNPLASMVLMETIDLSYNQIRDTNAFSQMPALNFVSLAYNDVCDVGSLVALVDTGAIGAGDTVHLDGNHLLSTAGQTQLAALQNSGAHVTVSDNNGTCPTIVETVQLRDWPTTDVLDFAGVVNNFLLVPCNNP